MRPRASQYPDVRWTLVSVYAITVLARTMVIALIPILAYEVLGTAQRVSEMYLIASLFGIAVSIALPRLLRRLGRQPLLAGAALSGVGSAIALSLNNPGGLVAGLILHVLMVLTFENVMSLYIMQHIPRRRLAGFEPLRIFLAGASYGAGPWLGIALAETLAAGVPLAVSAGCAVAAPALLAVFMDRTRAATAAPAVAVARGADVLHFWAQPRLRLAWLLTTIRAAWWAMYVVYVPIFAVGYGLGASFGGALVSLGSAFLLLAPLWGRLARRTGIRPLLLAAYGMCGLFTSLVALLAPLNAYAAACALMAAALAMSAIDGMGNVTFLRAVRTHQRTRMTPIFTTYRDVGQVGAAGLFAVLLIFLPLAAVFAAAGITLLVGAALCRYLPRRF